MGFDIIVRKDCVPLLLEVNSAPSLTIDHNGIAESDSSPPVRSLVDEVIFSWKWKKMAGLAHKSASCSRLLIVSYEPTRRAKQRPSSVSLLKFLKFQKFRENEG